MGNLDGFNASDFEAEGPKEYEAIPPGTYSALIVESNYKMTKAGTGKYLELVHEITEGEHEGRRLWARLNLENPNPEAVRIAKAELATICRAVGILTPSDSAELHERPLLIRVSRSPRRDTGELSNDIKGWFSTGASTSKPSATPADSVPF